MDKKLVIALLIPFVLFFWACEKNPAREELERMNVKYSKNEFIKRVKDSDYAVVKLFLAAGINVDSRDKEGGTALMYAAYKGNTEIVKLLVEHGCDVNAKASGSTALNSAAAGLRNDEGNNAEVIRFLVEHGADVNARPKYSHGPGETALIDAAWAGNLDIVRFLVEHGADVNARGQDNRTALTWAAQDAPVEVIQYLLEHGADPNARIVIDGKDAGTALTIAEHSKRPRPDVVKLLKEAGAKK